MNRIPRSQSLEMGLDEIMELVEQELINRNPFCLGVSGMSFGPMLATGLYSTSYEPYHLDYSIKGNTKPLQSCNNHQQI